MTEPTRRRRLRLGECLQGDEVVFRVTVNGWAGDTETINVTGAWDNPSDREQTSSQWSSPKNIVVERIKSPKLGIDRSLPDRRPSDG